jgi:hypothetical protein
VAALVAVPGAPAAGSFRTNDELLNRAWAASAATASAMVSAPVDLDPRGCDVGGATLVILDGADRDRCPYVGDLAVTAPALFTAGDPRATAAVRSMLLLFAGLQHSDGLIQASPHVDRQLADYSGYFVEVLYGYVLWSGDRALARRLLPTVARVLDEWYPAQMSGGLMVSPYERGDYSYADRHGRVVAYFNAQLVRALRLGARIAEWVGDRRAARWDARASSLAPRVHAAFWDRRVAAYRDTADGPDAHALDGNAFMILAGVASVTQARSALDYMEGTVWRWYGSAMVDVPVYDDPDAWGIGSSDRVYPFITYFELLARFRTGLGESALRLIRREWGYMLANGPGTTWETIGPFGGGPVHGSWAHGWAAGAAPVLTANVLGVEPTSPGFETFTVAPRPAGQLWAEGVVVTPRGDVRVAWRVTRAGLRVTVTAPAGTVARVGRSSVRGTRTLTLR